MDVIREDVMCIFANKVQEKRKHLLSKRHSSVFEKMVYEVCSAILLFIQDGIKPTTKTSYLLKIAQMLQIKCNTVETLHNCSHHSRAQSLYREYHICEMNALDFYVYKHNSLLNLMRML